MARHIRGVPTLLCVISICFIVPKGAEQIDIRINRNCGHGDTSKDGKCHCQPCWTGPNCDKPVNPHKPEFTKSLYEQNIDNALGDGETLIFTPEIADQDKTDTCKDLSYCPCADVSFSIEGGNEDSLFTIDPRSGSIKISKGSRLTKMFYELEIAVRNKFGRKFQNDQESKAIVVFKVSRDQMEMEMDSDQQDGYHHIEKRSTAEPNNVTFTLIKKYPFNDTTEMRVGSRVQFQLQISFPTTTTDILVELFTPDNETTVMILCDVKVSLIGNSLSMTGTTTPVMDAKTTGSVLYDRAIINLGNVTSIGCTNIEDCSIHIDYEAIMVENTDTTNGSVYWVSAGAEYNNEEEVWVGQASFTTILDDNSVPTTPTFNFTGPGNIPIGSSALFQVDMYLPNPSTNLNFDAFAPLNTSSVMTICSAKIMQISDNFLCGFDQSAVTNTFYNADSGAGNGIGHLAIGNVVNKRSRELDNAAENNLISVQFAAHMYEDTSLIGDTYWVGAAFELGSSQIWAAQIEVTPSAAVDSSSIANPTMTYVTDNTDVYIGQPKIFQLEVAIPESTTSTYSLEVLAPFSSTAIFQLCSVTILSVGTNMPCLTTDDKTTVYTSRGTGVSVPDTGVLNIHSVTNLAMDSNVTANVITFNIIIIPLNHASATVGSTHKVTATVTHGGGAVNAEQAFVVQGDASVAADNSSSPTFNMSYAFGDENVNVGTATKVYLDIFTNRSVTYPLMDIEFIMPVGNTSTKFSVCRARMLTAGKNLPCVTPGWINTQITYSSKFSDTKNDRALLSMGTVCNYEVQTSDTEDEMRLEVDLKVEDHEDLLQGTKEWVSAGNMYYDTKIWIGQIALYTQRATVTPSTTPYIVFIQNTTLSQIPIGYVAVYSALIKIAPQDSADVKIVVTSSQDGLYVCGLNVHYVGDNLPCVDNTTAATYTEFASGGNQVGTLNLSIVTNTGSDALVSNSYVDSNTILVQVIMQLSSTATDGLTYNFDIEVYYTTSLSTSFTNQAIVATTNTSGIAGTVTESANYTFTIADMSGTNDTNDATMYIGEAKRFLVDIIMPDDVTHKVIAKFLTPTSAIGLMEICDAAVIQVGENFPCLDKKKIDATFTSRSGSQYQDIAALDLGYLRSAKIKTDDTAANTITVEAVAKLLPHSSLSAGSTVPFHAVVNVNDMELWVAQMDLTVIDTFNDTWSDPELNNDTLLAINHTNQIIPMKVGEITTVPVVLNVPAMSSSKVMFDVDIPVNNTAVAIVKDIRLISTGRNIGCLYENVALSIMYSPTFNSTSNSCEMNKATLDFGIVPNAGLMYRKDVYQDGDNSIIVEMDIQVVDNELAENGEEFWLSIGSKQGKYVAVYDRKFSIIRDGTEKPDIQIAATVNTSLSTSALTIVDVIIQHTNISAAAGVNTSALFYLPPYMMFKQITYQNVTPSSVTIEDGLVDVQFDSFLLCEIAAITVELEPNNSISVSEDINTDNTLVAFESGTNMKYRTGSSYASDAYFSSNLQYINFSATVTKTGACSENLGMESGFIKDCQITASVESPLINPAPQGRLKGNSAWCPFVRGIKYYNYRYFQVYFGNKTAVHTITIEQGSGFTHYPTSIRTEFSNDNMAWQVGETIGITIPFTETNITLTKIVEARYIRIYIVSDNSGAGTAANLGLKFEFFGCYLTSDMNSNDVCSTITTTSTPVDFYFRSMAEASGHVYVCDANPSNKLQQHCHRSSDGSTWKLLDSRLGSFLGHESTSNRLFAYANDQQTTMVSVDNGLTWETVPYDYYVDHRIKSTFTSAKNIPWVATDLQGASPHSSYQLNNYGATFDGIMKLNGGSWSRVLEWESCCS